jgi:hypothetical protein
MKKYFSVGDLVSVEIYGCFERYKVYYVRNTFVSLVSITNRFDKITIYGHKFKELLCNDDKNLEGLLIYDVNFLGDVRRTTKIKF